MRGIKKIEHYVYYSTLTIDTDNVLFDRSTIYGEMYRIIYAEGQTLIVHHYSGLPKKAKKFFFRKYNYLYLYKQEIKYSIKYTTKINTYTFKEPI